MVSSHPGQPLDGNFKPVDRHRLYEQVLDQLRTFVASKSLCVGDRLPSERTLASRLGISRTSVKQAILILEVQGLVETRHGGGTYLRSTNLDVEEVDDLIERRERLPDVLEAREAVEAKLASLAAERRTDADLAAMEHALTAMRQAVSVGNDANGADRAFHLAMAESGHSRLLLEIYLHLAPRIAEVRRESLRQPGRPPKSLADHERIFDAVAAGEATRAVQAVRQHLRTVSQIRLLTWEPDWPDRGFENGDAGHGRRAQPPSRREDSG